MSKNYHPFHMVDMSPWPLMVGFSVFGCVMGLVELFVNVESSLFCMSLVMVGVIMILWWRDVVRESTFQGFHSSKVLGGLMIGMILFILSEVLFFFSFFWAFFYSSLSPTVELGLMWPPKGISPFNVFQVPLLNTIILLSSGVSVTWCHQSILNCDFKSADYSIMLTWGLGVYFIFLQMMEYKMAGYTMSDSVFGSVFFMATGFHGFHVVVGSLFLFVMWLRNKMGHFSMSHHFGFEASAWYWHFVDVVWLFLFSVVYWWGT